jgi:phosphatidylserine decarboxylase
VATPPLLNLEIRRGYYTMIFIAGCAVLYIALLVVLAHKWGIDGRVAVPAATLIGIAAGGMAVIVHTLGSLNGLHTALVQLFLTFLITFWILAWRFYRNPERTSSADANAILSPADGKIIYIKRIEESSIPFSEKCGSKITLREFIQQDIKIKGGFLVGIAMSFIDVHVNRSPIGGRVEVLKHIKGHFLSLKNEEAKFQNERALTVISRGGFQVAVLQIASRLVRQIVMFVTPGQEIRCGQRIGMIRFGSQVDVIIPDLPSLRIELGIGAKVKAGLSILARFH